MSTTQSNDIDIDRRLQQDRATGWRENFVDHPDAPRPWTDDEFFGCGEISQFPGADSYTIDYWEAVIRRLEETTGTELDPFGPDRQQFDDHTKESYIQGHPALFAALRFARMKSGEPARTLSVPSFDETEKQLFLQVGTPIREWTEDEATFTGEELSDWLYHAETGPYELREADEAEWPDHPGERFSPALNMKLVRLR